MQIWTVGRLIMNINDQLFSLYEEADIVSKLVNYNNNLGKDNDKGTSPLLLKSYEEYEKADVKIIVFGKETNGWVDPEGGNPNSIMASYENFFKKGNCTYRGQFWNLTKMIIRMIRKELGDKSVHYLWNNIVKTGKKSGKGFPRKIYTELLKENINKIIPMEIDILKPDFIIFFTGPNSTNGPYDNVLNDVFSSPKRISTDGFNTNELCEIVLKNVMKSFRLYHPVKLLYNNRKIKYMDYFNKILKEIKSCIK
jgi:hypothetical protein